MYIVPRIVNVFKTYVDKEETVTKEYFPLVRCSEDYLKTTFEREYL